MNYTKTKRLSQLSGYLFQLTNQGQLFEMSKHEKAVWDRKVRDLTDKTKQLQTEIEKFKVIKFHRRRKPTEAYRILTVNCRKH